MEQISIVQDFCTMPNAERKTASIYTSFIQMMKWIRKTCAMSSLKNSPKTTL